MLGGSEDDRDVRSALETIRRHGVTVIQMVPGLLGLFLEEAEASDAGRSLRRVFCGGAALGADLCERVARRLPGADLVNLYGPTEATIDATSWVVRESSGTAAPIGRPVSNTRIYLLDRRGEPVAVGVPGEIHIGGASLARGYRGHPDWTASRFVPDPLSGLPGSVSTARETGRSFSRTAASCSSAARTIRSRSAGSASSPARSKRSSPVTPTSGRPPSQPAPTHPARCGSWRGWWPTAIPGPEPWHCASSSRRSFPTR